MPFNTIRAITQASSDARYLQPSASDRLISPINTSIQKIVVEHGAQNAKGGAPVCACQHLPHIICQGTLDDNPTKNDQGMSLSVATYMAANKTEQRAYSLTKIALHAMKDKGRALQEVRKISKAHA
eukprot:236305-Pelagomonas_calceolata.AAC.1